MKKLSNILQEIQIQQPKPLKELIYDLVSQEGGMYDLEEFLETINKNPTHYDDNPEVWDTDEQWMDFNNPSEIKAIGKVLKQNFNRIKIILISENEIETINIREYKDLIAWTEYPETNEATGYLIFLK